MRKSFVFHKRPNSLIKSWAGVKMPTRMKKTGMFKNSKRLVKKSTG